MITLARVRIIGVDRLSSISIANGIITDVDAKGGGDMFDLTGLTIAPGLIDLQINGAYGRDFTSSPHSLWEVGARLPEQGVTAFLPTIITAAPGTIEQAISALASRPAGYTGAEPLGLHLEGPMLSDRRSGTHPPEWLRPPSLALIDGWSLENGVRMVTLAPELEGAGTVIETLRNRGVIVAGGHTAADLDQSRQGFGWGITHVTHLFNAMEPLTHRRPGLIGALVADRAATAGVIVDGHHIHPVTVGAAWRLLGPDRLALVTDAMSAAGLSDGTYYLGGVRVEVVEGVARNSAGSLAGSTLTLDEAVRNLMSFTSCAPAQAIAAASTVPAAILGVGDRGKVAVGQRADLVAFDDDWKVVATMIGGHFVFGGEVWR